MLFTVNGQQLELTAEEVQRKLRVVGPEPLHQYAIQVDSVLYPVKQAFEVAAGVPRRQFTTQTARRVLAALGFDVVADRDHLRSVDMPRADLGGTVRQGRFKITLRNLGCVR